MITSIDVSQEIFAMNILKSFKSSLKYRRKHVLRHLQLYGDQTRLKPGLHISRKNRKHRLENMFFKLSRCGLVSVWTKSLHVKCHDHHTKTKRL